MESEFECEKQANQNAECNPIPSEELSNQENEIINSNLSNIVQNSYQEPSCRNEEKLDVAVHENTVDEPKVSDEKLKVEEAFIEEKANIPKDFGEKENFDEAPEMKSEPLKTNEDGETFPERQKEEVESKNLKNCDAREGLLFTEKQEVLSENKNKEEKSSLVITNNEIPINDKKHKIDIDSIAGIIPMQTGEVNSNTDELKSNNYNNVEDVCLGDSEPILHLENNPIPESSTNKNEADHEDDVDDDEGFGDFEEAQNETIPDLEHEQKIEKKLHDLFHISQANLNELSQDLTALLFNGLNCSGNEKRHKIMEKNDFLEVYLKENKCLEDYEKEKERIRKLNKRPAADLGKHVVKEKLLELKKLKVMNKKTAENLDNNTKEDLLNKIKSLNSVWEASFSRERLQKLLRITNSEEDPILEEFNKKYKDAKAAKVERRALFDFTQNKIIKNYKQARDKSPIVSNIFLKDLNDFSYLKTSSALNQELIQNFMPFVYNQNKKPQNKFLRLRLEENYTYIKPEVKEQVSPQQTKESKDIGSKVDLNSLPISSQIKSDAKASVASNEKVSSGTANDKNSGPSPIINDFSNSIPNEEIKFEQSLKTEDEPEINLEKEEESKEIKKHINKKVSLDGMNAFGFEIDMENEENEENTHSATNTNNVESENLKIEKTDQILPNYDSFVINNTNSHDIFN